MIPAIYSVASVEMIRDGGSLAACFHGSDNCEYWLFFEIQIRETQDDNIELTGYAAPRIVNQDTSTQISTTWAQASVMLDQIGRLIKQGRDMEWHGKMQEVAASGGAIPSGIEKVHRRFRLSDLP